MPDLDVDCICMAHALTSLKDRWSIARLVQRLPVLQTPACYAESSASIQSYNIGSFPKSQSMYMSLIDLHSSEQYGQKNMLPGQLISNKPLQGPATRGGASMQHPAQAVTAATAAMNKRTCGARAVT